MEHYDRTRLDDLAREVDAMSEYSRVPEWQQRAQQEQEFLRQCLEAVAEEIRPVEEAINNLTAELEQCNAEYKRQSFFKRLWAENQNAKVIAAEIDAYKRQIPPLREQEGKLSSASALLQKFMDYVAQYAPQSHEHKAHILKQLKLQKKELQTKKREATMAMREIRQEARTESANAGKRGLFGMTGSFGDGQFSDKLSWYDPSLAAAQRRAIRQAKESTLVPIESTKENLEAQILGIDKQILFVEKFQ